MRMIGKRTAFLAAAAAVGLLVSACGGGHKTASTPTTAPATQGTLTAGAPSGCKTASQNGNVAALPGFQVCLFAAATTTSNHADSVVLAGSDVFIGWQNVTAKDGTDTKTSTISEYTTGGKLLKSWSVRGHNDGMRVDPTTHLLWVMCNEDGAPRLYTIDPAGTAVKKYSLPPTPHGGGFDDIQFTNGLALIDASNPSLNSGGNNVFPALYKVQLSGSKALLTSVLKGNAKALTLNVPVTTQTLNLTDPDSMMIDPQGDLVLDDQGDNQLLFIRNVGTPSQQVKVLSVGTQVDDSAWATSSKGCLLVADGNVGIYSVCSSVWVPGTVYTAAPNDFTVIGFIGTINMANGAITPVIVGIANPHGMAFVPQ